MADTHAAGGSVVAAGLLILLLSSQVVGVGALAAASRRSATRYVVLGLFGAAMGAVVFQVVHALEHVLQLGYWFGHARQPPWMTPWAMPAAHGFADLGGPSPMALGMELLHLVGNSIFLVGLVTLAILVKICAPGSSAARTTRIALWLQGLHLVEHVALTSTLVWAGRPIGLSTFFGLVDPGPLLWTYRVWWHFLINLVATLLLLRAVRQFWPSWSYGRTLLDPLPGWAAKQHEPSSTPAVPRVPQR